MTRRKTLAYKLRASGFLGAAVSEWSDQWAFTKASWVRFSVGSVPDSSPVGNVVDVVVDRPVFFSGISHFPRISHSGGSRYGQTRQPARVHAGRHSCWVLVSGNNTTTNSNDSTFSKCYRRSALVLVTLQLQLRLQGAP